MEGETETSLFKRSNLWLYSITLNTHKGDQWVAGCIKFKRMVININSFMGVRSYD